MDKDLKSQQVSPNFIEISILFNFKIMTITENTNQCFRN